MSGAARDDSCSRRPARVARLAALVAVLTGGACAPAFSEVTKVPSVPPVPSIPIVKVPGWPDQMRGVNIILGRIKEADVEHLATDWRANHVRLMCGSFIGRRAPYDLDAGKIAKLHEVVEWCRKSGLYVVINSQPPQWRRSPAEYWKSEAMQKKYTQAWVEIAKHYAAKGEAARVAYDLHNEPHGAGSAEKWPDLAREMTAAIRAVDKVHPIVIEPAGWGNAGGFKSFTPTGDERTVYSFHNYDPFNLTHQVSPQGRTSGADEAFSKSMAYPGVFKARNHLDPERWDKARIRRMQEPALEFRRKHKVRLWCGEFGCTRWANGADRWMTDVIDLWEAEKIGWSWYSYREWYAMDLEKPTDTRDRSAPRSETEAVKIFKKYLARTWRKKPPASEAPREAASGAERAANPEAAKILRSARQAERAGLVEVAKTLYRKLVKEHPESAEAGRARERLAEQ